MRLALSKLEKNVLRLHSLVGSEIRLVSWLGCVIYFTDQLMTPYFSGGCTLNGTPGGDRWGRVLCEEIGWLSEPLHRFDAVCSGSTNLKMQTHGKHDKIPLHRKHTTKPTPARRPRTPRDGTRNPRPTRFSILRRFHRYRVRGNRPHTALAISKNDECYTHTDRHTDRLIK